MLAGAGLLLALFVCAAPSEANDEAVGLVIRQAGIATVFRGTVPAPLAPGDNILPGDRIVTGPAARVSIAFDDTSTVVIGPGSDVAISTLIKGEDGSITDGILDLVRGIMRTALAPSSLRDRFEIRTRSAVASVRSTEWIVEANETSTAVFVMNGEVAVRAAGSERTVTLEPGFGTDVPDGGAPGTPVLWGSKRAARALDLTHQP